nr:MAG: hypothetical protein [Bacteriophage sp.]
MAYKLSDMPLTTVLVEHYLFDLEYPVEKVSEIADVDKKTVEEIYEARIRCTTPTRRAL